MKRNAPPSPRGGFPLKRRTGLFILGLGLIGVAALALAAFLLSRLPAKSGFAPGETVEIAVVYPREKESDDFLAAIGIAVEQVNAAGGINGHPLAARLIEEESYDGTAKLEKVVTRTLELAHDICKEDSVLAVIGHGSSATSVPASAEYNRCRKLFLATHATATSLSNLNFDLTFALQPSNADNAAILAQYARSQGVQRMVVLSDDTNYGIETSDHFRSLFTQAGGVVLHHGRLRSSNQSIEDLLLFLLDNQLFRPRDIDAIFITTSDAPETANFIARARQLGLRIPILGAEYLYSQDIASIAGAEAMRDVVSVSLFDETNVTPEGKSLSLRFQEVAGHPPGLMASIGFDAVKVLTAAANKARSLDPGEIADTLRIVRYDSPYVGAAGPIVFDAHGLITDTNVSVVRHDGTRFHSVAKYRKPFAQGTDQRR